MSAVAAHTHRTPPDRSYPATAAGRSSCRTTGPWPAPSSANPDRQQPSPCPATTATRTEQILACGAVNRTHGSAARRRQGGSVGGDRLVATGGFQEEVPAAQRGERAGEAEESTARTALVAEGRPGGRRRSGGETARGRRGGPFRGRTRCRGHG